jgi:hypothetical protein
MNISNSYLIASVFWSAIGVGFWVYGKKQRSMVPLFGGALLMATTYFIEDALTMSLVCLALVAGMWHLIRNG